MITLNVRIACSLDDGGFFAKEPSLSKRAELVERAVHDAVDKLAAEADGVVQRAIGLELVVVHAEVTAERPAVPGSHVPGGPVRRVALSGRTPVRVVDPQPGNVPVAPDEAAVTGEGGAK